jgi:uncharacterized membrane protein YvlD (DUF360 family)
MRDFFTGSVGRFLAGFFAGSLALVVVISLTTGFRDDFSFLAAVIALGIFGGVLWVRRPPAFLTKRGTP